MDVIVVTVLVLLLAAFGFAFGYFAGRDSAARAIAAAVPGEPLRLRKASAYHLHWSPPEDFDDPDGAKAAAYLEELRHTFEKAMAEGDGEARNFMTAAPGTVTVTPIWHASAEREAA